MKSETGRVRARLSVRLITGLLAAAALLSACGNNGSPNYGGGGVNADSSPTVAPDVPRNVK
jgi:hypothetical protein